MGLTSYGREGSCEADIISGATQQNLVSNTTKNEIHDNFPFQSTSSNTTNYSCCESPILNS